MDCFKLLSWPVRALGMTYWLLNPRGREKVPRRWITGSIGLRLNALLNCVTKRSVERPGRTGQPSRSVGARPIRPSKPIDLGPKTVTTACRPSSKVKEHTEGKRRLEFTFAHLLLRDLSEYTNRNRAHPRGPIGSLIKIMGQEVGQLGSLIPPAARRVWW